jgi:hypothetical protein
LPIATQQVLLLVAADPIGDAPVLRRAARTLGISLDEDAGPAEADGLISIAGQVRFRHPLVRSAISREAAPGDRRKTHAALAAAVDPDQDPDRRAWHRAHGTSFPNDEVAAELERSADRANSRGGPRRPPPFPGWPLISLGLRAPGQADDRERGVEIRRGCAASGVRVAGSPRCVIARRR